MRACCPDPKLFEGHFGFMVDAIFAIIFLQKFINELGAQDNINSPADCGGDLRSLSRWGRVRASPRLLHIQCDLQLLCDTGTCSYYPNSRPRFFSIAVKSGQC